MNITSLGGRRFLLTLGCGAMTTLLCWFAKITGEVYATVIIATVGGYITGNTWQKIKGSSDAGA
jgi:hypothetical protein